MYGVLCQRADLAEGSYACTHGKCMWPSFSLCIHFSLDLISLCTQVRVYIWVLCMMYVYLCVIYVRTCKCEGRGHRRTCWQTASPNNWPLTVLDFQEYVIPLSCKHSYLLSHLSFTSLFFHIFVGVYVP